MKYEIDFNRKAVRDIEDSFEWGVKNWGEALAEKWLRNLYTKIFSRLKEFPLSCPLAPETSAVGGEVRQLVHDRYRILFTVTERKVLVLHLRGPYHHD